MKDDEGYIPQAVGFLASTFGDDILYKNADYNKFKAEQLYNALGNARPTDMNNPLAYVKAKDMPGATGRLINAWSKAAPFIRPIAKVSPYVTAATTLYDLYSNMQNRVNEEGLENFRKSMIEE